MRLLALDLGSSFTKAALIADGRVLAERQMPTLEPLCRENARYEIDAECYYQQVRGLIDEFLDAGETQGILFSTQMHGYVLTNADMTPIRPYVSWQDQLGAKHLPEIREILTDTDVYPSGVPLKVNLALCALLARRIEGELLPDGALLHTLGGYMIARLTGQHVCHITNAAPTGLADVCAGRWNESLIQRAGLSVLRMPQMVKDVAPVGTYRGAAVYPDIGDQQICAFGAGLVPEHSLHVNIGTAGLLGALCREFKVQGCESRPWLEQGVYLRTVSGLTGGRRVQALREQYPGLDDEVWPMLTTAPDAQAAACYQELADAYTQAAQRMDFPIRELCYSGGCVLKNPALRACIEEHFGLTDRSCTKSSDIWSGMIQLAHKIENG